MLAMFSAMHEAYMVRCFPATVRLIRQRLLDAAVLLDFDHSSAPARHSQSDRSNSRRYKDFTPPQAVCTGIYASFRKRRCWCKFASHDDQASSGMFQLAEEVQMKMMTDGLNFELT
jgi:hypothetical protein